MPYYGRLAHLSFPHLEQSGFFLVSGGIMSPYKKKQQKKRKKTVRDQLKENKKGKKLPIANACKKGIFSVEKLESFSNCVSWFHMGYK